MKNPRKLAWQHFTCMVPAEWEITSYSVEDRVGRLEFSTRHGFQGVISWESCKKEPEPETMMVSFLRTKVPHSGPGWNVGINNLQTRQVGDWLMGYCEQDMPCQAMCYLKEQKKLLHWVFLAAKKRLVEQTYVPILESMQPNAGDLRQYAVYGFDFQLPSEYLLEDMTVLPANVMIGFESKSKRRATFRRWGLTDLILGDEPLERFYRPILRTHGCVVDNVEQTQVAGLDAIKLDYQQRGQHQMDKFMGRYWKGGEAWLWHNRKELRLYAFEQIGPKGTEKLQLSDVFPRL